MDSQASHLQDCSIVICRPSHFTLRPRSQKHFLSTISAGRRQPVGGWRIRGVRTPRASHWAAGLRTERTPHDCDCPLRSSRSVGHSRPRLRVAQLEQRTTVGGGSSPNHFILSPRGGIGRHAGLRSQSEIIVACRIVACRGDHFIAGWCNAAHRAHNAGITCRIVACIHFMRQ